MRWSTLILLLGTLPATLGATPALADDPPAAFSDERAAFSVRVGDMTIAYRVMGLFVMPGGATPLSDTSLQHFLYELDCPLLLVR